MKTPKFPLLFLCFPGVSNRIIDQKWVSWKGKTQTPAVLEAFSKKFKKRCSVKKGALKNLANLTGALQLC